VKRDRNDVRREAARSIRRGSSLRAPEGRRCARCQKLIKREDDAGGDPPYCVSDCAEAARLERADGQLRELVLKRDQGVCAVCGEDCRELRRQVDALLEAAAVAPNGIDRTTALGRLSARVHGLVRVGFDRHALEKGHALWECDHVDPRVRGGPSTLENARTLCLSCHKEATASLAGERAAARRPRRPR